MGTYGKYSTVKYSSEISTKFLFLHHRTASVRGGSRRMNSTCNHVRAAEDGSDAFCRDCGAPLRFDSRSRVDNSSVDRTRRRGSVLVYQLHPGLKTASYVMLLLGVILASVMLVNSHEEHSNSGLWHRVGELFNREQIRQRKMKHGKADAVENGPKEISIFCPQDPTIKIVDLNEDERNRDECLVLNIAAPDISSRLVLFCNAHSLEEDDDEFDDLDGEGMHSDEL